LEVCYWIAILSTALLSFVAKLDVASLTGHFDPLIPLLIWLKAHSWWIVVSSMGAAILAVIKKNVAAPWVKIAVKHILDEMRHHAFNSVANGPNFHHRVTLFRHVKSPCWRAACSLRWPFGGWLIPFARSGHLTQKISVCFRAPDQGDDAEGVAGQAFAQDVTLPVEDLPDVSTNACSETQLRNYARLTFVDLDWLREERSTARALIGIPVKVKGEPWGVIVVDSRATQIPDRENVVNAYVLIAKVLGEVLNRS
jgi:hypothetical protein